MKREVRLEWVEVCVGLRLCGFGIVWVRVSDPDRPSEARLHLQPAAYLSSSPAPRPRELSIS